ncbi:MAG: hypothetical protein VW547_05565 [Alphaproteobacteria bacterium]
MGYVLCNAICYGGIFAYTSCSAYILIGLLGVSPDFFGLLYAITVGPYGVETLVASQFTGRVGLNRMIFLDVTMMQMAWAVFLMGPTMLISFYLLVLRPRRTAARAA